MSINGVPIQILLPKSKEERTEVISRLLSTFVTHKLQEHLNFSLHFLNFSELFQYIFILVSQLWCHEFRKHSFNHILKVCKALLKNQEQVYYNTRVSTQLNTSQHESARVRHESTRVRHASTRINTSPTQVNTNQHEPDTSQHKSTRVRHKSTRINTSLNVTY